MPDLNAFIDFLTTEPVFVLTGAGISARSGIPTYRDNDGNWQRSDPIKHQEFLNDESKRKRYWGRSMVGWKAVSEAKPNGAHKSIASLQKLGLVNQIVTQNVDGLHDLAGAQNVIDLHGRLDTVICLQCGQASSRADLQPRLEERNPALKTFVAEALPDGDADIDDYPMDTIDIPECINCYGALKPDVVFFGGSVPRGRVEKAMSALKSSKGMLVLGSSLQVFSGYRFCKAAHEWGIPIGCINQGVTRADDLFTHKWSEDCAELLSRATAQFF